MGADGGNGTPIGKTAIARHLLCCQLPRLSAYDEYASGDSSSDALQLTHSCDFAGSVICVFGAHSAVSAV